MFVEWFKHDWRNDSRCESLWELFQSHGNNHSNKVSALLISKYLNQRVTSLPPGTQSWLKRVPHLAKLQPQNKLFDYCHRINASTLSHVFQDNFPNNNKLFNIQLLAQKLRIHIYSVIEYFMEKILELCKHHRFVYFFYFSSLLYIFISNLFNYILRTSTELSVYVVFKDVH